MHLSNLRVVRHRRGRRLNALILSIGLSLATPFQGHCKRVCAKALEADKSEATPAQELALAKCILAAGDSRTAIKTFQKLESHADLAPYARYLRAEASYDAEEYATTAELLSSPFPFSAQSMRKVALLKGKAYIQSGIHSGRDYRPIDTKIAEQHTSQTHGCRSNDTVVACRRCPIERSPRGWQIGIVSNLDRQSHL